MTKAESMRALLAAALLLAPACSPQAAAPAPAASEREAAVHPVSGLEVIPLTVTTPTGTRHDFRVEVARTPQQQAQGLMFRTAMEPDEGMVFVFPNAQMRSFWMKNTVLSLDILFIGPDRRVINVAANTTPYSERSIPSAAPAVAVLELNAGRARELGIVAGSQVDW